MEITKQLQNRLTAYFGGSGVLDTIVSILNGTLVPQPSKAFLVGQWIDRSQSILARNKPTMTIAEANDADDMMLELEDIKFKILGILQAHELSKEV